MYLRNCCWFFSQKRRENHWVILGTPKKKRFSLIHISRPLCAILIWWLVWLLLLLLRRGVTRRSTIFPQIVHETATWWWEICCSVVGIMHVFLWPLFLFSPFQVSAMNCKFFLLSDLNLCTKKQIYLWRSMFNFFMHINIIVIRSIFFKNHELDWSNLPQNSNHRRESFVQKSEGFGLKMIVKIGLDIYLDF